MIVPPRVLLGDSAPLALGKTGARIRLAYWEGAVDELTDALLHAKPRGVSIARARLLAAHDRLLFAKARLARLEADEAGVRWLSVAPEVSDG